VSVQDQITIFEVGARDGLQNEAKPISLEDKKTFVTGLAAAGLRQIELGAFVRPDKVPQMADTDELYRLLQSGEWSLREPLDFWALVPNEKGLERAVEGGVKNIAVFTAATDGFSLKNTGRAVKESLDLYGPLIKKALKSGMRVRGYVSTVFGCPYEGKVDPQKGIQVTKKLLDFGVEQVSLGDTIGVATPKGVDEAVEPLLASFGHEKIAVHFHDTWGAALVNAFRSFELGVRTFDSSAGGLGGCPYAPGATGNLATEDLVYLFEKMGVQTGVNFEKLCQTSLEIHQKMKRAVSSRALQAYAASC
jgi:hydroxymethylglutaryl-CoA lyase